MPYETVELEDGILIQSHTPRWDAELMDEPAHEDLIHLKRIAQRAREELERAKPGSAVWEALRFILSPSIKPIKGTEIVGKEPTWESKSHE